MLDAVEPEFKGRWRQAGLDGLDEAAAAVAGGQRAGGSAGAAPSDSRPSSQPGSARGRPPKKQRSMRELQDGEDMPCYPIHQILLKDFDVGHWGFLPRFRCELTREDRL